MQIKDKYIEREKKEYRKHTEPELAKRWECEKKKKND